MRSPLSILLIALLGCGTQEQPTSLPGPDGWDALANGELERAAAIFAKRQAAGDADAIGGLIRVAHIQGEMERVDKLLLRVDVKKAPARTLLAAGLAAASLAKLTPHTRSVAQSACALRAETKLEVRAGAICTRLALRKKASTLRRCLSGCTEKNVVALRFVGPSPVVLASIDGKAPAPFLIDSGASTSVLTKRYAAKIGVKNVQGARYRVNSPGGLIHAERALARLRVGKLEVADVPFSVIDLPFDDIAGLISPHDAFGAFRVRFDFRAFTFTVAPSSKKDHELVSLPLRIAEGNPHIWVAFGKRPPRPVTLDTGAVTTTLTVALDRLGPAMPRRGESKVAGAGGKSARAWLTQGELAARAGALRWSCVAPKLYQPGHDADHDAFYKFGLLGMDFMMGRVLEIDGPARAIRISSAAELAPWKKGQQVVLEILGGEPKKKPVTVVETLVGREGDVVTLEVQLAGVKEAAGFRYTMRDSWATRGTWLIARQAQSFLRRQKDGSWKEAPAKEIVKQWLKVFTPFSASGKNVRIEMVTLKKGNAELACTKLSMDAMTKAGPARLRSWECPHQPWRVVKLDLVTKKHGSTIWGFRQRGVVDP